MSVNSLGMVLGKADSIMFWASHSEDRACLVIDTEGTRCEITMDRVVVAALRDQLPAVLDGLERWVAGDAGCAKAVTAEQRAVDAATHALDLAMAAEAAGARDVAASLREAANQVTVKASAVDAAVGAFEDATAEADHAAEGLIGVTREAAGALRRLRAGDRPGESVAGGVR